MTGAQVKTREEVGLSPPEPILRVRDLNVAYGNIRVLWDVNLEVYSGEIVVLIGSNGAGKSTFMTAIAGMLAWKEGDVLYKNCSISGLSSERIVSLGISLVPQGKHLFRGMSVVENLTMGAYLRRDKKGINTDLERVFLLFPVLKERQRQLAGKLSGGEQQMCAIARGLMSNPSLLLIDELSLGLSPFLVDSLFGSIKEINRGGTTILIVEQDVELALQNSERSYVMERGKIVNVGASRDLLADDSIRKAYLGL